MKQNYNTWSVKTDIYSINEYKIFKNDHGEVIASYMTSHFSSQVYGRGRSFFPATQ